LCAAGLVRESFVCSAITIIVGGVTHFVLGFHILSITDHAIAGFRAGVYTACFASIILVCCTAETETQTLKVFVYRIITIIVDSVAALGACSAFTAPFTVHAYLGSATVGAWSPFAVRALRSHHSHVVGKNNDATVISRRIVGGSDSTPRVEGLGRRCIVFATGKQQYDQA